MRHESFFVFSFVFPVLAKRNCDGRPITGEVVNSGV